MPDPTPTSPHEIIQLNIEVMDAQRLSGMMWLGTAAIRRAVTLPPLLNGLWLDGLIGADRALAAVGMVIGHICTRQTVEMDAMDRSRAMVESCVRMDELVFSPLHKFVDNSEWLKEHIRAFPDHTHDKEE